MAEALCAKEIEQVDQTWEALNDDAELEKVTEQLHTAETEVNQLKNEMNKFPLEEKMAKTVEMKKLQQQVIALRTQQQQRNEKVT